METKENLIRCDCCDSYCIAEDIRDGLCLSCYQDSHEGSGYGDKLQDWIR
jgi:hypothetical protein